MYLVVYFVLVLLAFDSCIVSGDKSALCSIWNGIEQSLKNEDFHISCTTDSDCNGLNCSGTTHGYNVDSRIHLYACEDTPSVEFELNVPKLNVNNIKKRLYHNDSIPLAHNLNIEFELQRTRQELVFGLFVHYLSNGSFPLLRMPIPVISHMRFPVECPSLIVSTNVPIDVSRGTSKTPLPTSKSFLVVAKGLDQGYSNCSITNSTCGEDEICMQLSKVKPDGICVCISDYKRDEGGKCIFDPTTHSPTESPKDNPESNKKDTSNVSLLLTAILVPISVILVIVGVVYASIRFRVCQHLRRRLRVQVYEHVLLGEDDEDDVTNPVA